ncbi:MAG: nucleotidyltransferase family protein [Thermoflexales bacterium]|nr:nucleotidyltransferase family protein [Thermoflexales bacterium]MDW8291512.1 nucleotidyltransferase family protein [Anaerolineae bacterium]
MDIAAVVLAAGSATRFGQNKLLLPFGASTVIGHTVASVLRAGAQPVVVVTGHEREHVEAALAGLAVQFTHNARHAEGEMILSAQVGLRALLSTNAVAAFIVLGDMPLVPTWVFARLATAYRQRCGEIVAPMFGAQRGHPVLLGRSWWEAALALSPDVPLRALLQAHPHIVAHVLVNTDAVLRDVDTPELYAEALKQQTHSSLGLQPNLE